MNPQVSNPNDFKVVDFTNRENFDFTPEMGCMFNSSPIFGIAGVSGIKAGESIKLPYHVGQQLALNLAKVAITRRAPDVDPAGIPTGVPLWDVAKLEKLKNSYLTDLYTQERPVAQTETQRLMQMVDDLNKTVEGLKPKPVVDEPVTADVSGSPEIKAPEENKVYQDKKEVIEELEKRGIQHDKRKSKDDLAKLLNA